MKFLRHLLLAAVLLLLPAVRAQAPGAVVPAAPAAQAPPPGPMLPAPHFLENLVDSMLDLFHVQPSGHTPLHWAVAALFVILAILLRRALITVVFGWLKKRTAKAAPSLKLRVLPALEAPMGGLIILTGVLAAIKVLGLSEENHSRLDYAAAVAYSVALLWLALRAVNALLDHLQDLARERQLGVAAFMPWIKKSLLTVCVIFGALKIAQGLGADVGAFLAGLGIGGLAFALAAQDTLANFFGSVVVAIDQPFKLGETVLIGSRQGVVEDIGLRSTRLRLQDQSLAVIPNKTVAAEAIQNLSRFTGRRAEQTIGLTYDTTPEQMEQIVAELRQIVLAEPSVDAATVQVYFIDYGESSLDIWLVYVTTDPNYDHHLAARQRINLGIMRAVTARGLAFAFPTQVTHFVGPVAKQLAAGSG
jgi:MscS family membrane protein